MSAERTVPFFDYPRAYLDDRENFLRIFDEVCSRGAFIMQKELSGFEAELRNYTEAGFAMGVAMPLMVWKLLGLLWDSGLGMKSFVARTLCSPQRRRLSFQEAFQFLSS